MPVGKATIRIEGQDATAAAWNSALRTAKGSADKFAGIWSAALGGISVAGIVQAGLAAIHAGDDLNKAAIKAGIAGSAMSELSQAAKLADVDLSSLSTALKKMQVALSQAESGGKDQINTLKALGLTVKELSGLKADKQMEILADAITRLSSDADKARAVTELFGKAGADLLPFFEQGAGGIRAARAEMAKLGNTLTDEQIARLSEADDKVKKLDASWTSFWNTLVAKVSPALTAVLDQINMIGTAKPGDTEIFGMSMDVGGAAASTARFGGRSNGDKRLGLLAGAAPGNAAIAAGEEAQKQAQKNADAIEEIWKSWAKEHYEDAKEAADAEKQQYDDLENYIGDGMENLGKELEDLHIEDPMIESAEMIKGAFLNAFDDMVNTGKLKVGELLKYIAAEFTRRSFASLLDSAFGIGSKSSSDGGWLSGLFTGSLNSGDSTAAWVDDFKADGGPVMAGKTYVVGERGAELFRPSTNGSITPNGAMGGSVVINAPLTINGANAIDAATANRISAEHARRLMDELDRRNMTRAAA